ncbi:hypothetical protein BH09ACT5_BH09ACT5_06000 [soil metagenome]
MRKQLGTYLFTGGGALLLGLVPSLVGNGDNVAKWILLGVVGLAIVTALILQPWRESEADKKRREYDQAKITVATQQELTEVELELARLRHAQQAPTLRDVADYRATNGASSLALGAASSIVAAGQQLMAEQDLQRELGSIEMLGLEKRRNALLKIVEG